MTVIEAPQDALCRQRCSPLAEAATIDLAREFGAEVIAFLKDLAVRCHASAATQNHALLAVVPYRKLLELEVPALVGLERARRPDHLPARYSLRPRA